MRVMIVVTHLLGTGHLVRAATLARAFAGAGHAVQVVSGGTPVPHLATDGFDLVQLPALKSDGVDFSRLLDASGAAVEDAFLSAREGALLASLTQFRPDVLITELFPFGRRSLKAEFQALLKAANEMTPRPLVLSSIRDILAPPSKPKKVTFADDLIARFYDGVLVHSDAAVVPLETSWPVGPDLAPRLHYTGFVAPAPPPPHPDEAGVGEILVSAGGGDVGNRIYEAVLALAETSPHRFRLLMGGDAARRDAFAGRAPKNVTVEPPRPDFRSMLCHATASISMCGYNTALDLLQTGVPAVIVPFDDGSEVEQSLRGAALARQPGFTCVTSAELTPARLHSALADVIDAPRRTPVTEGMAGAAQAVEITVSLLAQKRDG